MDNKDRQKRYRQKQKALRIGVEQAKIVTGCNAPCPDGYDKKMWAYACERAERAQRYAEKMPEHIRPSEVKFQDPEWQYQDQGRYPLPRVAGEEKL